MKQFLCLLFGVLWMTGCEVKKPSIGQLIEADQDFSALSEKSGFAVAFIEFAHKEAVLLRKDRMPVVGKGEVEKLFEKATSSTAILKWEPLSGQIAASGDLGFTYGIYTAIAGQDTTRGTYVSIWKKDEQGRWKYVLDTGNEGLGTKQ